MTKDPVVVSQCADCGVGTFTLGEWYMVDYEVWEQAWLCRRKSWHGKLPGTEILCIGCLEKRIGRTLTSSDFIDAPCNDPTEPDMQAVKFSDRMRDRLTANQAEGDLFTQLA